MIDLKDIKIHQILLKNLTHSSEIFTYFKSNNIRQYAYSFLHLGTILKHGESASVGRDRDYGERVRRQAENIDGWGKKYHSSSGKEMKQICDAIFTEQAMLVVKDDVTILVYDFSNHNTPPWRSLEDEIMIFESELINRHEKIYGELPIGNIRAESHLLGKKDNDGSLGRLFDWG